MIRLSGKELGRAGENLAAEYLAGKGYEIIGRNIMAGHREIDLICLCGGVLVFIEVKTVKSLKYGAADEIFSAKKTRNLRLAAMQYLSSNKSRYRNLRLDLVYVDYSGNSPQVHHYQDIA